METFRSRSRPIFILLFIAFALGNSTLAGQQALLLNDQQAYATARPEWIYRQDNFTLEGWIWREGEGALTQVGGVKAIPLLSKGRGANPELSRGVNYFLGIDEADHILFGFQEGQASTEPGRFHFLMSVRQVSLRDWYHVAVSISQRETSLHIRLFLNGEVEGLLELPGVSICKNSRAKVGLGTAFDQDGAPGGNFCGRLDEIRIWRHARTVDDIRSNMFLPLAYESGLLALWNFEYMSGDTSHSFNGNVEQDPAAYLLLSGMPSRGEGTDFALGSAHPPDAFSFDYVPERLAWCFNGERELTLWVDDEEADELEVRYYGRRKDAGPKKPFSIVGLPDTQYYTENENGNEIRHFYRQTEWIREVRDSLNIAFVAHLGDCVEWGDSIEDEWRRADTAMSQIEPPMTGIPDGIPYGIAVGNHDQAVIHQAGNAQMYNRYFGEARFRDRSYYGGHFGKHNNNHFELFSASGIDFIAISFEYDFHTDPAILHWADSLLSHYRHRKGIVYTHYLINGRGSRSGQGAAIYYSLRDNPNLFLMLSGHVPGEAFRVDHHRGNTIHTLLSDFQELPEGGLGFLRILTFYPDHDRIEVSGYSPSLDSTLIGTESSFEIPFSGAWELLGMRKSVSGSRSALNWKGLEPGATYEWYAVVSDGQHARKSAVREFFMPPIREENSAQKLSACEEIEVSAAGALHYASLLESGQEEQQVLMGTGVHTFFSLDDAGCVVEKRLLIMEEECVTDQLRLYPNPARNQVRVEWPEMEAGSGILRLRDLKSRTIWERAVAEDEAFATLSVAGLPSGTYLLELKTNKRRQQKLLLVQ